MANRIRLDTITSINASLRYLKDPVNFAMGDVRPGISVNEEFKKFVRNCLDESMGYTPVLGKSDVRNKVAQFLNARDNCSFDESNIAIVCGAIHGLSSVFNIIKKDCGEVILNDPSWSAYVFPIKANGLIPKRINYDRNGLDIDAIIDQVDDNTVAVVLNNPENPTGLIYSYAEICNLVESLKKKKPNVWLIADEVYIDMVYGEKKLNSLTRMIKDNAKLIVVNSLSKSCAMTGWRAGYVIANSEFISKLKTPIRGTISCVPRITQLAIIHVLENFNRYNTSIINMLQKRRDIIDRQLSKIGMIRFTKPKAGIYIWIDVSKTKIDIPGLSKSLFVEKEVAVVPGNFFGAGGKNFIRISFGYERRKKIEEGAQRIADYLKSL